MKKSAILAGLLALAAPASVAPAFAAKPPVPMKTVLPSFFTGRWYEIVRTPNVNQTNCEAPTYEFGAPKPKTVDFTLTCHRDSPAGKAQSKKVTLHLPQDEARNKFKVSAGPLSVGYVVIDRAPDQSWAILGTDGGRYVWLLSRTPDLGEKAALISRIKSLGYARLEEPAQG